MSRPFVSVIIPVYNGELYLGEALRSVFSQDYFPFEVIVVDDGSTDGTAAVAKSFKDVRYIYQQNKGAATSWNRGLMDCRGDLIALLDCDDLWSPNKLKMQVEFLVKNPDVKYVLAKTRLFLDKGQTRPSWLKQDFLDRDIEAYFPSVALFRRSVFETVGVFNPGYIATSDADWFFRAKDAGLLMAMIPQVLMYRRIHNSNMSTQVLLSSKELVKVAMTSVMRQRLKSAKGQSDKP
jgi:glycosyltransferase involved in cell wall biosynthesis